MAASRTAAVFHRRVHTQAHTPIHRCMCVLVYACPGMYVDRCACVRAPVCVFACMYASIWIQNDIYTLLTSMVAVESANHQSPPPTSSSIKKRLLALILRGPQAKHTVPEIIRNPIPLQSLPKLTDSRPQAYPYSYSLSGRSGTAFSSRVGPLSAVQSMSKGPRERHGDPSLPSAEAEGIS